jgi:hypothetical protein
VNVPPEIIDSLKRYVEDRIPVGGFLTAVLANDLYMAFARADQVNEYHLRAITAYVDTLPIGCRGSYEAVRKWLKRQENEETP